MTTGCEEMHAKTERNNKNPRFDASICATLIIIVKMTTKGVKKLRSVLHSTYTASVVGCAISKYIRRWISNTYPSNTSSANLSADIFLLLATCYLGTSFRLWRQLLLQREPIDRETEWEGSRRRHISKRRRMCVCALWNEGGVYGRLFNMWHIAGNWTWS